MICAECNYLAFDGQVHTWVFCQLHKAGWDRATIIANVRYTAEVLALTDTADE